LDGKRQQADLGAAELAALIDEEDARLSLRSTCCEADSRAFAVDAWLLSRSSVADGIDKLAAGFVGIDDRVLRVVE
jgi:hypothetical protein